MPRGKKNLLADTDYTSGKDNRYKASVHIGRVSEIVCDETQANVRAIMPDKVDHKGNPLVTKPIPVWQISAGGKKSFAMPRIGQNIVLLKMPNGTSNYHVIGTFYTTSDPPPVTDPMLDYVIYDDGSIMQFNASNGQLDWKLKGDVNWDNEKGASLKFKADVTVHSDGTILIEGVTLTHIKGPMKFEGNIEHIGNMTTTGTHTDANGHHTSAARVDELLARIEALEERVRILETNVRAVQ